MELRMDLQQPVRGLVGSMEPSHLWIVGLAAPDGGPISGPQSRPYSFWAECECPDDCLRDHENE
jgi:hypothetical protein